MYQAIENSTSIKRLADGATIPADASLSDYANYLDWKAEGGVLLAAVAKDWRVEPLSKFRGDREAMLNRLTGIGLAALVAGDAIKTAALGTLRQGLLDLPSHPSVTAAVDLVAFKLAMKTQYIALIAALPAALKVEFAKVGQ